MDKLVHVSSGSLTNGRMLKMPFRTFPYKAMKAQDLLDWNCLRQRRRGRGGSNDLEEYCTFYTVEDCPT